MSQRGVLKVTACKANDVADIDFAFAGDSDPYLVIEVNGDWKQTKMIRGNLNPVWNEEFTFMIDDPESDIVNFILWDSDVGQDTIIASCAVGLQDLVEGQKRGWELPLVRCGPEGDRSGTLTIELLAMNFSGLKVTIDNLNQTINELKGVTSTLRATQEELQKEVGQLQEVETNLRQEVTDLQGLNGELSRNVEHFKQKLQVLESTVTDLKQTRDDLDQQVSDMEGQNTRLNEQLDDLKTIQESMRAFADQAGEDFATFVQQLTEQVSKNEKLVEEFANQNAQLKKNRQQQQVNMLLHMSASFQDWDDEAGLSPEEFQGYLSLLGPEYERRIRTRLSSDLENPFGQLDIDNSGTLNLSEVRTLLHDILQEIESEEESQAE